MDGSIYGGALNSRDLQSNFGDGSASDITARLVTDAQGFEESWRLRHAAYSAQGYIEQSANGLFMDEYDNYPTSKTVVVYKEGIPVASVRLCLSAPDIGLGIAKNLPAFKMFPEEIAGVLESFRGPTRHARAAEVTRLSRHPDLGNDFEPVFALFRMVGYLLLESEADAVFSLVCTHHTPFYRRLGFRKLGEPRPYPNLKVETALVACVRAPDRALQQALPMLGLVSKDDANYQAFLAGLHVPVFGTGHVPTAALSTFERRFEGSKTGLPPGNAWQKAPPRYAHLPLAA